MTKWSPIRSVIMQLMRKIRQLRSRSLLCSITSTITDRIGRHGVPLPINHIYNKNSRKKEEKNFPEKQKTTVLVARYVKKKLFLRQVELCHYSTRTQVYCPVTGIMCTLSNTEENIPEKENIDNSNCEIHKKRIR